MLLPIMNLCCQQRAITNKREKNRGKVWAFHGEITTDFLPDDSDLPGLDDDEDEKPIFLGCHPASRLDWG
jgi:hypothetical protein